MSALTPSSDLVSQAGRAAHELGLAALLGGNLFGRLALHPAVERITDPRERGEVVNAAWRRYGTVNSLGLAAMTAGWVGARAEEARGAARLTGRERALARVKDGLVGTVVVTGLATAAEGVRFARQPPDGAVPLTDGSTAAPSASPAAARLKRKLNVLGAVAIGAEAALVIADAALAQENFRRAPLRRRVRRWG
ncbi:hypothetical protein FSW04_08810 [Baekduia soli]|uniref:Uncharacterized protein n=1 Tax=Baekduia soli TaxID=496014 RepID=A0A5B8U4T5_9ACTN|nr:hypothetical protein [Baekduia soli]QEC47662.1 hypothetical protein FSW04_08810 [Baekduia soli]